MSLFLKYKLAGAKSHFSRRARIYIETYSRIGLAFPPTETRPTVLHKGLQISLSQVWNLYKFSIALLQIITNLVD